MSTKKTILLSFGAIILLIVTVVIIKLDIHEKVKAAIGEKKTDETQESSETDVNLGEFHVQPSEETETDEIDDYYDSLSEEDKALFEQAMNDGEPVANRVFITNLDIVNEILTLQALSDISEEAGNYLNEHGYGGYHELTIIKDTIVYEKYYPKFQCVINDIEDKKLEIRYNLEKYEFEFQLQ